MHARSVRPASEGRHSKRHFSLIQFDGKFLRLISYGNHSHQKIGTHADNRQVSGARAYHEQQIFLRIEPQRSRCITRWNREALSWIAYDAAIENLNGGNAPR